MKSYSGGEHVNVGSGTDITILELAELIRRIVGFEGEILTDCAKPDGTPRKLLDVSRLEGWGWRPRVSLERGITDVYRWYCQMAGGADV